MTLSSAKPMHILVVDDHLPNVRMLQEWLGARYRVSIAQSGQEALGAMRHLLDQGDKPDLVLLDMQMVGMQGWHVLSQWRADEELADVPVIFLVNKIDSDTERLAYQAGVVDCIRKPFALPVVLAKVEQHLLLSKQQLYMAHQLRERTAQLTDALQQTRQQHQLHSQDFAGMAQVLRSPINAILGLSHLLELEKPTPSQTDKLGQIQHTAHQLLRVVNDLLDLSEMEAGRLPLQHVPINPQELLADVYRLMLPEAKRKGVTLKTVLPSGAEAVRLMGDPLRIAQILLHLCDNAIRHTQQGQVALGLKWLVQEGQAWEVRFYVRDTGTGLDEDTLHDLLAPQRLSRAHATQGRAGLGLTLSKRLAGLMQGQLGGSSAPQEGASFWLDLVMQVVETAQAPMPCLADDAHQPAYAEVPQGASVLLVEDDPQVQACMLELLAPYQLKVDVADNGAQGLNMARVGRYDVVLMDVQLPYMDGLEATRAIHQLPGKAGLQVVGLASHLFSEDRLRCKAAGMCDFVIKPVSREALHRVLALTLQNKPQNA